MQTFKVALLQLAAVKGSKSIVDKGVLYCRQAKDRGADLALFPEMWSNCYSIPSGRGEKWKTDAIDERSDYIQTFTSLARELNMAIGITYLEKWQGKPRNSIALIDRFGNKKFTYAKVHTCDFGDEKNLTPGDNFYTAILNTESGDVNVGCMICFDREFPESARILMLKGAEVILVPNACDIELNRMCQLRSRAYENMAAIAMANYAAGNGSCNGHSCAFDGMAFEENTEGDSVSRDMLLVEGGESEGIHMAEIDMDKLREYRSREVWGNAYRKVTTYSPIILSEIADPFLRGDDGREKFS